MDIGGGETGEHSDKAAIAARDNATITRGEGVTQRNKQSLDYALKSGLAGGLAACTVSSLKGLPKVEWLTHFILTGKNRRGAS